MAQSTNDVIPCAGKLTILNLLPGFVAELERLHKVLRDKSIEFDDVVKMGRTQLQDAVPIRLGQSFGAYAAVIPLFVKQLMRHESPVINGDGEYSRDFTYIDNVIQMNELALTTTNPDAVNQIYNTAFGERTTLNQLVGYLKEFLGEFDGEIRKIEILHGPNRVGDIPHSLASIDKAKKLLGYEPQYSMRQGLQEAVKWYWNNL